MYIKDFFRLIQSYQSICWSTLLLSNLKLSPQTLKALHLHWTSLHIFKNWAFIITICLSYSSRCSTDLLGANSPKRLAQRAVSFLWLTLQCCFTLAFVTAEALCPWTRAVRNCNKTLLKAWQFSKGASRHCERTLHSQAFTMPSSSPLQDVKQHNFLQSPPEVMKPGGELYQYSAYSFCCWICDFWLHKGISCFVVQNKMESFITLTL